VVLKDTLEAIGMKVDLQVFDTASLFGRVRQKDKWDLLAVSFVVISQPDPLNSLWLFSSFPGWYETPEKEALLEKFASTPDPNEQVKIADEMVCQFYEDAAVMKYGDFFLLDAATKDLKGYIPTVENVFWEAWLDR